MDEAARTEFEKNLKAMAAYQAEFTRYNRRKNSLFKKYFKYWHRLELIGLSNIPSGPALLAANHSGGWDLDIVCLSNCCHPTREIQVLIVNNWHFLESNWGRYWVGSGIPLWTQGGIRYEYIDPYLKPGGSNFPGLVAIYPEGNSGTFQGRHRLRKFFPGVARIAINYQVPIVPVAQIGFQNACPIFMEIKHEHGPNDPIIMSPLAFPLKLKVEFGKPFTLEKFYGKKLSKPEEFWIANQFIRPKVAEILSKHARTNMADVDVEMKEPR